VVFDDAADSLIEKLTKLLDTLNKDYKDIYN